jgi:hypothetical protein
MIIVVLKASKTFQPRHCPFTSISTVIIRCWKMLSWSPSFQKHQHSTLIISAGKSHNYLWSMGLARDVSMHRIYAPYMAIYIG